MKNFASKPVLLSPFILAALKGMVVAGPRPAPAQNPEPAVVPHDEREALDDLRTRLTDLHSQQEAIRATADKEARRISEDEVKQLEHLADEFDSLDDEIRGRERLLAQKEKLGAPATRRTQPSAAVPEREENGRQRITGGDAPGAGKGTWGFRSLGEYAQAVQTARKGNGVDNRILAAASTYGNETTLADGGFMLPPDFRETIAKKLNAEDSLLARTDQQFTSSNRITVPTDETTPHQESGGILSFWDDEGAAMTPSKPNLQQIEVKANRLTALVPVTDELLQDAPSLSSYLPSKVADKFTSKLNKAIISGDGVAKPQGLMNAPSKITVAAEGGQAVDTIVFANVSKMWSRLHASLRGEAVWLMNQDIEPQLFGMVVPGTQPSFPAYMPPGGLSGAPYATLFGRPVIAQEHCKTIGDEGDLILTNLRSYLTVQKAGGMKSDTSIHLYFDQNIVAFRFVMRVGGQSWWASSVARANGSNTLSNVVTLAAR